MPFGSTPRPWTTGIQSAFLWVAKFGSIANLAFAPVGTIRASDLEVGHTWIVDRDGNLRPSWGKGGSKPEEFAFKMEEQHGWWSGIAFASEASFAVAECGNHRFELFDAQRVPVKSIGAKGTGNGQFLCPSSVAFASFGTIYVSDLLRNDIQHFDSKGGFLAWFQTANGPSGMTTDREGNLVVTATGAGRMQVFPLTGNVLMNVGSLGNKPGQLTGPVMAAVNDAGNFYIADQFADFESVFNAAGGFVGTMGSSGETDESLANGDRCDRLWRQGRALYARPSLP